MNSFNRDMVAQRIAAMPTEQVSKLLIFMSGMEPQNTAAGQNGLEKSRKDLKPAAQIYS